jgi:hypothetical protein
VILSSSAPLPSIMTMTFMTVLPLWLW